MDPLPSQLEALLELEARHEDLLERLDELDKRVERVLTECVAGQVREAAMGEGSLPPVETPRLVDRSPQPQSQRDAERRPNDPRYREALN